jgi:hypothetical protein
MAKTRTRKTQDTGSKNGIMQNDNCNVATDAVQTSDHIFDVFYDAMIVSAGRIDGTDVLSISPLVASARNTQLYDKAIKRIEARPYQIKAAVQEMVSHSLPNQNEEPHGIIDHLVHGLHAIADAMTVSHMSGAHLKGPLKYVGPLAEVTAEVLHNPAGELTEKLVCGTAITFTKESVNIVIAAEFAATAGIAASFAATPAAGYATAGFVAVASYKMIQQITTPIGKLAQHACHGAFNYVRQNKQNNAHTEEIDALQADLFHHTMPPPPTNRMNKNADTAPTPNIPNQSMVSNSTASIMLSMGFSESVINRSANSNNDIINSCATNIQSLHNSQRNFRGGISAATNNVNLSNLSVAERPTITYTSMMDRQVALANSPFMLSSFQEPPQPQVSTYNSGFFYNGGEGGSNMYCDRFGNCYSTDGIGRNDCSNSEKKCESSVKF